MMHAVRAKVNQQPTLLFVGGMGLVIGIILVWGVMKPPSHAYDDASGEVVSRMDMLPYNGRYGTPVWTIYSY